VKQRIDTTAAPRPAGAYSQGIVSGGLMFTAGFGPTDPATGTRPEGITQQTRQVMRNIGAVLAEQGLDFSDVVKVTAHLQHLKEDFRAFNAAYLEFVQEPYPVRTTVGSQLYDILVEIDVVAVLRSDDAPTR
jgi:2-iminobutanoate/2-iminopropanoate deaminase